MLLPEADHQLQTDVGRLLAGAPGTNVGGEVYVLVFTEVTTGERSYHVGHSGAGPGYWSSEETGSLDLAQLAAECLALRCGARLEAAP